MSPNIIKYVSEQMNCYGKEGRPFFFMFDFEMIKPVIHPLDKLPEGIIIDMPVYDNTDSLRADNNKKIILEAEPVSPGIYKKAFYKAIKHISHGNSYLLNLTFPARITINTGLEEIFYQSRAKYRLLYDDEFLVFSPETFVRIDEPGTIRSYPMKGTIDASVRDAENVILKDEKEKAEHNTIVDLLRNDISMHADNVKLVRYRYIDTINTGRGKLLQVSSEIEGSLGPGWKAKAGDIITSMLPAGSVSGAPKDQTVRIIKECEIMERGYYTGIFGIFTGKEIDSAVMIRYIEQNETGYVYRSGGGITYLSEAEKEYNEIIKKIYVPVG